MMKIKIEQGYLTIDEGTVKAHGFVLNHPELDEGVFCDIAQIQNISVADDALYINVMSGNQYQLKFTDIDAEMFDHTRKSLQQLGVVIDMDKVSGILQDHEANFKKELAKILKPKELYLRMLNDGAVTHAYYRVDDNEIAKASITYHVGTFVDSILIRLGGLCDFRFYTKGIEIESYYWSQHLKAVKIFNVCEDFGFRGSFRYITCKSGEITTIEAKEYAEGVVYPPDTSGQSILWDSWEKILRGEV